MKPWIESTPFASIALTRYLGRSAANDGNFKEMPAKLIIHIWENQRLYRGGLKSKSALLPTACENAILL